MATLTAACPACEQTFRTTIEQAKPLVCPHCQQTIQARCPDPDRELGEQCLTCPSRELFVRKDFPPRLGLGIVVAGFAASTVAWFNHAVLLSYAILFAAAGIDAILYLVMGNVLVCYRCHAQYRGLASLQDHPGFNLEIHERYRQQAARLEESARLAEAGRLQQAAGGAAGAASSGTAPSGGGATEQPVN